MKVLQPYKDWLLINRGEIRPEIGDIVQIASTNFIKYPIIELDEGGGLFLNVKSSSSYANRIYTYIESCYVEIDYNPNEAIDFQNYLDHLYPISHLYEAENKSIEEMYKQFKENSNGK